MTALPVGDYDIRSRDIRQLFAGFGRIPLSDSAIWSLSLAQATMPENHVGYQAWITMVADVDCHGDELADWSKSLAHSMAHLKPLLGKRRRALVQSYAREWGDQAALDGLCAALYGHGKTPGHTERGNAFKCDRDAYRRLRDLITGVVVMQMAQYESALTWAVAVQRRA